ncbi:hypothetical protein ES703_47152 [subsurface metagenome]
MDVAGVGVGLAFAGVAALESYAVDELEGSFAVAGCNHGALVGLVGALGDADFIAAPGGSEGVLKVVIGIGPG